MANGHVPKDIRRKNEAANIGASTTYYGRPFHITAGGSRNIRIEAFVGKVVASTGVTLDLETSSGFGIWESMSKAATSISSTTNKTVSSINTTTGVITATAHGYSVGDAVAVTAAALPGGLSNEEIYYVKSVPSADTLTIGTTPTGGALVPSSAGTTVLLTAVSIEQITLNVEVAGDQADMPLRAAGRIAIATGAGDSVQLLKAVVSQAL
jgi:hypothetical protein